MPCSGTCRRWPRAARDSSIRARGIWRAGGLGRDDSPSPRTSWPPPSASSRRVIRCAAAEKIVKSGEPLTLTLQRTPDILADLGHAAARRVTPPILVGFAAETGDLLAKARDKRVRKNADLIVANDVSEAGAGFDVDTN